MLTIFADNVLTVQDIESNAFHSVSWYAENVTKLLNVTFECCAHVSIHRLIEHLIFHVFSTAADRLSCPSLITSLLLFGGNGALK